MKLIARGKVKEVYDYEPGVLMFKFTDQISGFDKVIPSEIPKKGESLNRTSTFWFRKCEDLGIKTHYISTPAPERMRVKRVNIIYDMEKIDNKTTDGHTKGVRE